jgi:hypothetical protein
MGAINQLYFVFSQGFRGLGATQNGQDLASRINAKWLVGIDTGGTFTDLIAFDQMSGSLQRAKYLPSRAIRRSLWLKRWKSSSPKA